MKKLLFAFSVLIFCACGQSKKKTENGAAGSSLEKRLEEYMKLNDEMNLEKIMDYIYPKLFTIAPKEEVLQAMKDGFDNAEVKVDLDSVKTDKIFPVFEMGKGSYAKVSYSMIMLMNFTLAEDSTGGEDKAEKMELIKQGMAEKFGEENVSIDDKNGGIRIRQKSNMVAAKDEHSKEWTFVNLNDDDPMINKLFSKEVLDKLATYK